MRARRAGVRSQFGAIPADLPLVPTFPTSGVDGSCLRPAGTNPARPATRSPASARTGGGTTYPDDAAVAHTEAHAGSVHGAWFRPRLGRAWMARSRPRTGGADARTSYRHAALPVDGGPRPDPLPRVSNSAALPRKRSRGPVVRHPVSTGTIAALPVAVRRETDQGKGPPRPVRRARRGTGCSPHGRRRRASDGSRRRRGSAPGTRFWHRTLRTGDLRGHGRQGADAKFGGRQRRAGPAQLPGRRPPLAHRGFRRRSSSRGDSCSRVPRAGRGRSHRVPGAAWSPGSAGAGATCDERPA
ncbi:hypothetical protein SAMN04489717_3768 [Actinopolymorpha singaporensis]|uniref:Uncharacterized protein n=1 Tax=Actinopolymorpha singaporensis TaxID=117157 RepID=A0A1H1UTA0_9ACTN|nr:hypothetical protein SAMN04489717_3768 [Actinopolymorpha singaporensis]